MSDHTRVELVLDTAVLPKSCFTKSGSLTMQTVKTLAAIRRNTETCARLAENDFAHGGADKMSSALISNFGGVVWVLMSVRLNGEWLHVLAV